MINETPTDISGDEKLKIIQIGNNKMKIYYRNKFFILEPNRYDINTLMMLIDLKKINKIEEKFEQWPDGICRIDFINLLKKELPSNFSDPFDELNLIYGLYKLFCEIDLSGDEIMQWSEFTQFIIDRVEGEDDSNDPNDTKGMKEKEMIKYKRYMISPKVKDYNIHKKDIISAVFHNKIDKLFVLEYDSKVIKIYNPRTGRCELNYDFEQYFQNKLHEEKKNKTGSSKKQKFVIDVFKPLTFSVLHLCINPMNILSICLSSNIICFFVFTSDVRGDCIHEMHTTSLQKRIWFLPKHNIWVSSGRKHDHDRWYYIYELDVEFERAGLKIECDYNEGHWHRGALIDHPKGGHQDEILDVIEITKPMLILTACLDGKIRLINLYDKEFLSVWSYHEGGVRSLDYNPFIDTNGLIISTGFEYYINLFATDLSLEDGYKGKLEGHYAPVVSCKFLSNSYMCASVDEEAFVKIWDAKQRQCLQSIASDKKNLTINRLLYMPRYNRFVIYGNKMFFYDGKYRESEITKQTKEQNDINYPLQCEFNKYYMRFYIATMRDLRIYSSENGNLVYVFKKFLDQERFDSDTQIKCITFDYRHRLVYIGFSNGTVQQFNSGNGSLIKPINEFEVEKDGMTSIKTHHTKDISGMFLFSNKPETPEANFVLVTTGYDSLVNMYNEKDPETSSRLRIIKGSHKIGEKINEILCMDFSKRYNQFATGSIDGIVVLWDFEITKMEEICFIQSYRPGNYNAIYMKFLDPYPVLAVAYSDGSLFLWGIKPDDRYKGECFFRTKNLIKKETGYYPIEISSMLFVSYDNKTNTHTRITPTNPNTKIDDNTDKNSELIELLPEEFIIDDDLQSNPIYYKQDSNNTKNLLIIGDDKGWIKFIDLNPIFKKYKIQIKEASIILSSFNILKKEEIYAESNLLHNLKNKKSFLGQFTSLYPALVKIEEKAHQECIIHLSLIEDPFSFISVSKDQRIKIWNINCEILGEIYTGINNPNPPISKWSFCIDLEKLKRQEIEELMKIMREVEDDTLYLLDMIQEKHYMPKKDEENENRDDLNKELLFKTVVPLKKKRFQKIIVNKENYRRHNEDVRPNDSFEGRYIQEMKKKIDTMFHTTGPDIGMNEMSKNVIDNVAANKDLNDLFFPLESSSVKVTTKKLPRISMGFGLKPVCTETDARSGLYSEKFMRKSEENVKEKNILPLLKNEFKSPSVKFKHGVTEKMLLFEYYQNSYKQCVNLKHSTDQISTLRANYNLMWDFVDKYKKRYPDKKSHLKTLDK